MVDCIAPITIDHMVTIWHYISNVPYGTIYLPYGTQLCTIYHPTMMVFQKMVIPYYGTPYGEHLYGTIWCMGLTYSACMASLTLLTRRPVPNPKAHVQRQPWPGCLKLAGYYNMLRRIHNQFESHTKSPNTRLTLVGIALVLAMVLILYSLIRL